MLQFKDLILEKINNFIELDNKENIFFIIENKAFYLIRGLNNIGDFFYLKTSNQFKSKKNNRPIFFRQDVKNKLLASYKKLSPNKLLKLISAMVIIGKDNKLLKDENILNKYLKYPEEYFSIFQYYLINPNKNIIIFTNLSMADIKQNNHLSVLMKKYGLEIKKLDNGGKLYIKDLFKQKLQQLYFELYIKYLFSKYQITSIKKFKEYIKNTSLEKILNTEDKIKKLYKEVKNTIHSFKLDWYIGISKSKSKYEQDLSNSVQLFEDEYQKYLKGYEIAFDDKYFVVENLNKIYINDDELDDTKDKIEYLAIITKLYSISLLK